MREIIFDTETTGLDSSEDRVIEIGAVELDNRFPTGRTFHHYIEPDGRPVHPEALAVHGISNEMLAGKPRFGDIAEEWLDFCDGAKLVAHNATFDMGFINAELSRIGQLAIGDDRVIDTLMLARRKHPMGPNSLDALCRRYGIDNSHRKYHGALLDAELLAEVYIEMLGGRQAALGLVVAVAETETRGPSLSIREIGDRPEPLAPRLTQAERQAHAAFVAAMGESAVWHATGLLPTVEKQKPGAD